MDLSSLPRDVVEHLIQPFLFAKIKIEYEILLSHQTHVLEMAVVDFMRPHWQYPQVNLTMIPWRGSTCHFDQLLNHSRSYESYEARLHVKKNSNRWDFYWESKEDEEKEEDFVKREVKLTSELDDVFMLQEHEADLSAEEFPVRWIRLKRLWASPEWLDQIKTIPSRPTPKRKMGK